MLRRLLFPAAYFRFSAAASTPYMGAGHKSAAIFSARCLLDAYDTLLTAVESVLLQVRYSRRQYRDIQSSFINWPAHDAGRPAPA